MIKGSRISPFKIFGKSQARRDFETNRDLAQADVDRGLADFENFEFQTFAQTNPFETMQVNLEAAQFQRDQIAQEQADTLQALRSGATGAGAAALATAMSRQAAQKQQAIAADIGQQEQRIQMKAAEQDAANQALMIQQQQAQQQFNIGRMETMLGMDMAKVAGLEQAEQARRDRNAQLIGAGIGLAGSVLTGGLSAGGFLNPE
jgi:hypothetical protein